ncbi:nucleoside triphosphate pyrophosphohydrolase [Shewanella sp. AS16]|uniref:nucleoside triphosphate pyrophosphohydrolase n=1 Tax=Shewanella sp. AS16 TaxID=2907625 RepID=UPI001F30BC49|nr:nucleoside triphosphate pyrophosphohydrolase [Shewanella sp. AS16]MCE9686553.1 nucleoside triphosphate pyrophosphohydrolase [Shewanella sp. AS16]
MPLKSTPSQSTAADIERLLAIMAKLRDPDSGCPWDKAQSFATIVPFTLEEAYEVADTIERLALEELPGELGDLLFQVIFYCQLGKEQGLFDFSVVVDKICTKLTERHPHVFGEHGGNGELSAAWVKDSWEAIKAKERQANEQHSVLDNIPLSLPALARSVKIQQRVARVGFDWAELEPVVAKIHEEIDEVLHEVRQSRVDAAKVRDEMGDLLFAVTNLARHLGVEPEQALRQANAKFERRFRGVETLATADGKALTDHDLEALDAFWDQVKHQEKR